jgi:hypothetical protein
MLFYQPQTLQYLSVGLESGHVVFRCAEAQALVVEYLVPDFEFGGSRLFLGAQGPGSCWLKL